MFVHEGLTYIYRVSSDNGYYGGNFYTNSYTKAEKAFLARPATDTALGVVVLEMHDEHTDVPQLIMRQTTEQYRLDSQHIDA